MTQIVEIEVLEKRKLAEKIKRNYGLEPDSTERIGRCSCGAILFCVRIFTGSIDSQCRILHICSDLNCLFEKTYNSLSLKPEQEDFQCPLCEERKDTIAMAVIGQRRTDNYNKLVLTR